MFQHLRGHSNFNTLSYSAGDYGWHVGTELFPVFRFRTGLITGANTTIVSGSLIWGFTFFFEDFEHAGLSWQDFNLGGHGVPPFRFWAK